MPDPFANTAGTAAVFAEVPIEVTVSVGRTRPLIRELLALEANKILTLDRRIEDPVELLVGDRLIARGHLEDTGEEAGNQLAVRITEVISQGATKE